MKSKLENSFWITNISNKAIHLPDLNIYIMPYRSMNLLDKRHQSISLEQIEKSKTSGDLLKLKKYVCIRKFPPNYKQQFQSILINEDAVFERKKRSAIENENIVHEELNISDDEFASENAESAEADHLGKWNKQG